MLRDNMRFILMLSSLTLVVCSVLLAQSGMVMIAEFYPLTGYKLPVAAMTLGSIMTVLHLIGFVRLTRFEENTKSQNSSFCCMVLIPGAFLGLAVALFLTACVLAHVMTGKSQYFSPSSTFGLLSDINTVQRHFNCCGDLNPRIWYQFLGDNIVPDSCCRQVYLGCGTVAIAHDNFNEVGCRRFFLQQKECLIIFGIISSVITLFEGIFVNVGHSYWRGKGIII